jgi:hypothetical protein
VRSLAAGPQSELNLLLLARNLSFLLQYPAMLFEKLEQRDLRAFGGHDGGSLVLIDCKASNIHADDALFGLLGRRKFLGHGWQLTSPF